MFRLVWVSSWIYFYVWFGMIPAKTSRTRIHSLTIHGQTLMLVHLVDIKTFWMFAWILDLRWAISR